ncbi:MAG: T9SS type A sorting domain-containing protein [Bacteroidales bacterium]|nr:T9SS type A sorting domain-containing protein [Bacteroidales bacterium]
MKILKNKFFLIIILIFVVEITSAQEVLINDGNYFLQQYSKKYFKNIKNQKSITDTLVLPFFEDFSNSYVYPSETQWLDKFVFINNDFGIDNISYNVATFDAINEYGLIYPNLSSSGSKIADYLTSFPINLDYSPADSIYFSFFYQSAGNGNEPEIRDSIVLQFYNIEHEWVSIWHKAGGISMNKFQLVMIPITNPNFLFNGFQFRFYNYASISSNDQLSWKSNCDIWNLDYLKLDKNRTKNDTVMVDIAFIKNFNSLLKDYESVPAKHYANYPNKTELIKDSVNFIVKNNCIETYGISRDFYIYNTYTSDLLLDYSNDNENIFAQTTLNYKKQIDNCEFIIDNDADSAKFTLLGNISARDTTDPAYTRWNDTIRYYQYFENYYAYDDGSAEMGYGVVGKNSKLAYKFTPLIGDTLKGVYMYFNHVVDGSNLKYFYLTIWNDINGYPGDVIHEIEGVKPKNSEFNQFVFYPLDTLIYLDTTFYIGWRKTTNDVLNIGYDKNRNTTGKIFFNAEGFWDHSINSGALMIRPAFGKVPKNISVNNIETSFSNFNIYPNPTSDYININIEDNFQNIEIYDINGRLLLNSRTSKNINISNLNSGIYCAKVISNTKNYNIQKFVIIK